MAHGPYVLQHGPTHKYWHEPTSSLLNGYWLTSRIDATHYDTKPEATKARNAIRCSRNERACIHVVPDAKPNAKRLAAAQEATAAPT